MGCFPPGEETTSTYADPLRMVLSSLHSQNCFHVGRQNNEDRKAVIDTLGEQPQGEAKGEARRSWHDSARFSDSLYAL